MKAGVIIGHEEEARLKWLMLMVSTKIGLPVELMGLDGRRHFLHLHQDVATHAEARAAVGPLNNALRPYVPTCRMAVFLEGVKEPFTEDGYIDWLEDQLRVRDEVVAELNTVSHILSHGYGDGPGF
ncbi:MAG: hypothetical protein A3J09_01155 [Candidatus Zambryskibacteria bacterium RIFCSPLOWO2_02_FULL_51_21]|uniref:Uncharacterized protein n=1 Tax=Candidatus Zambryskibacteria bacterium RIFCSPHIGHO2_02_FULL_43_37 TaxID=1802749 RepID=A0A1G2TH15_9BACT|nr:MAG: hypothetical protein A2723_01155 [Candidatus Zambryskibacteria bacterium RIFCSPHIGHO2_01_FULL_52_18]OHA96577.1 MAG: hypothetical protein A3D49_01745 [Candidatus Zambryskibacteria bacterium RIFCSPHIGHO2_02_FULL_43_37]OHB11159.1 MAG: hypothetical protein A3J09_01155 [Candidatus Zambryskibacteria bacterium RIFCSPLOWO2_02_FULL_51_21]